MNVQPVPSAAYLERCFAYVDGALFWNERPAEHFRTARAHAMWNARFAGKRAGREMAKGGYRQVGLDGARLLEHRVIAKMHGISVDALIDHKDRCASNNDWTNLRPATRSENCRNNEGWRKKESRVGTWQRENGTWIAYIRVNGRHSHLGTFKTEGEAIAARVAAEVEHYG